MRHVTARILLVFGIISSVHIHIILELPNMTQSMHAYSKYLGRYGKIFHLRTRGGPSANGGIGRMVDEKSQGRQALCPLGTLACDQSLWQKRTSGSHVFSVHLVSCVGDLADGRRVDRKAGDNAVQRWRRGET